MIHAVRESWAKNWPEVRALLGGGLPPFVWRRRPAPWDGVPVFFYHLVDRDAFREDLLHLRRNGYRTLRADELLGVLAGERVAGGNGVVLTFDDGAANLFDTAFPLLREYGFHAVAFVAPAFHDRSGDFPSDARPCTWEELAVMDASGVIDVQSHTLEHRYVPDWPASVRLTGVPPSMGHIRNGQALGMRDDFRKAREAIEAHLGKEVHHLAFPRFDGTVEGVRAARETGYVGCWWGVLPGQPVNGAGHDPMRIARLSGEFVRRLPGEGRLPLGRIMAGRYGASLRRMRGRG